MVRLKSQKVSVALVVLVGQKKVKQKLNRNFHKIQYLTNSLVIYHISAIRNHSTN